MGAKTLSNAGLCWQLGAVEKIAVCGRSPLTGEQQAQVQGGSDSHICLQMAHVWQKEVTSEEKGDQEDNVGNVAHLHWKESFPDLRAKMAALSSVVPVMCQALS